METSWSYGNKWIRWEPVDNETIRIRTDQPVDTLWKINMEPTNHPFKKGTWSSKPPWLCSMLIFKGVYPPFSSQWHLLEERIDLGPGLLWHAEHRETGCLRLSGAKLDFPGWKFLKQQQLREKIQKILKELRSQTSRKNRIPLSKFTLFSGGVWFFLGVFLVSHGFSEKGHPIELQEDLSTPTPPKV